MINSSFPKIVQALANYTADERNTDFKFLSCSPTPCCHNYILLQKKGSGYEIQDYSAC